MEISMFIEHLRTMLCHRATAQPDHQAGSTEGDPNFTQNREQIESTAPFVEQVVFHGLPLIVASKSETARF